MARLWTAPRPRLQIVAQCSSFPRFIWTPPHFAPSLRSCAVEASTQPCRQSGAIIFITPLPPARKTAHQLPAHTTILTHAMLRWSDWVPTLGGRSVRPILDRVDYALTQLLEGYQARSVCLHCILAQQQLKCTQSRMWLVLFHMHKQEEHHACM